MAHVLILTPNDCWMFHRQFSVSAWCVCVCVCKKVTIPNLQTQSLPCGTTTHSCYFNQYHSSQIARKCAILWFRILCSGSSSSSWWTLYTYVLFTSHHHYFPYVILSVIKKKPTLESIIGILHHCFIFLQAIDRLEETIDQLRHQIADMTKQADDHVCLW